MITSSAPAFSGSGNASPPVKKDDPSFSGCGADLPTDASRKEDELCTSSGKVKKSAAQQKVDDKTQTNVFAGYGAACGVLLGIPHTLIHTLTTRTWDAIPLILPLYTAFGAAIGAVAAKGAQKSRDKIEAEQPK